MIIRFSQGNAIIANNKIANTTGIHVTIQVEDVSLLGNRTKVILIASISMNGLMRPAGNLLSIQVAMSYNRSRYLLDRFPKKDQITPNIMPGNAITVSSPALRQGFPIFTTVNTAAHVTKRIESTSIRLLNRVHRTSSAVVSCPQLWHNLQRNQELLDSVFQ